MVDRVIGRQMGTAVEAVWPVYIFERFTYDGQRNALTTKQVAGDIGNIRIQEPVHATNVLNPHDFQRWLKQTREPGKAICHTRPELDSVTMSAQCRPRNLVVQERIVI